MEKEGEGCCLRFRLVHYLVGLGCAHQKVEMPVSVNTTGRDEVMLTKTLKIAGHKRSRVAALFCRTKNHCSNAEARNQERT